MPGSSHISSTTMYYTYPQRRAIVHCFFFFLNGKYFVFIPTQTYGTQTSCECSAVPLDLKIVNRKPPIQFFPIFKWKYISSPIHNPSPLCWAAMQHTSIFQPSGSVYWNRIIWRNAPNREKDDGTATNSKENFPFLFLFRKHCETEVRWMEHCNTYQHI